MVKKIMVDHLSGIPSTLMYPVYARAKETQMENPIIEDTYSVNMVQTINFDFTIFENMPDRSGFSKKDLQTGIAVRTELLDKGVVEFLEEYPQGLVINLGCGLDARFFRLDNGSMGWIDVDLPEVIGVKKHLFSDSDRYKMLPASILEEGWLDDIQTWEGQGVMIIAEGTLMYFEEAEVRKLFGCLINKFPKAVLLFEVMGSALSGKVHPSVKCLQEEIVCPWGIHDYKSLESWHPKLRLVKADILIDHHRDRWSFAPRMMTWLLPFQKPKYGHAILQMKIQ
jgi:O-methyltransferase involved in polyketide biosynthesis